MAEETKQKILSISLKLFADRGIGDLALFGDLLVGEPAPLGEGELQLVAVKRVSAEGRQGAISGSSTLPIRASWSRT